MWFYRMKLNIQWMERLSNMKPIRKKETKRSFIPRMKGNRKDQKPIYPETFSKTD